MRNFAVFLTSFSLGLTAVTAAPALAQDTAAASTVDFAVGATVYDSAGQEIGPITNIDGSNVTLTVSDKMVALPKTSFSQTDKGPAITLTREQLVSWLNEQVAASGAALDAAIVAGADIRSAKGAAIVGKVKSADANGVVVATAEGDMLLPKNAFFLSDQGLATSFTAEQFAAAIAEAKAATANPGAATAETAQGAEAEATKQAN